MILTSYNQPAHVGFRFHEEFLGYLNALCLRLNKSVWSVGDEALSVERYAMEQQVVTQDETKRERDEKDERISSSDSESVTARFYERPENEDRHETIRWTQAIAQNKRLAIKGAPGSGKTFSTKATVIAKARELHYQISSHSVSLDGPFEIPVWITARDIAASKSGDVTEALIGILEKDLNRPGLKDGLLFKWLRERMKDVFLERKRPANRPRVSFFIVIDALDELTEKDTEVFSALARQLDRKGAHLVATCRTFQWEARSGLLDWENLKSLEIASLKRRQKSEFIDAFFGDEKQKRSAHELLRNNPAVDHATDNALILSFVCFLHLEGKLNNKTTYIDIYKQMQSLLFQGYWKPQREKPLWFVAGKTSRYMRRLEEISLQIFKKKPESNHFTLEDWDEACRSINVGDEQGDEFREELVRIGFLASAGVDDRGDECWSFLHRTLLEFTVAKALLRTEDWPREARSQFWEFGWVETLTFLGGLLDEKQIKLLMTELREEQEKWKNEVFGWLIYLEARFTGVSKLGGKEIENICDLIVLGLLGSNFLCRILPGCNYDYQKIDGKTMHRPFIKAAFKFLNLNKNCASYFDRSLVGALIVALEEDPVPSDVISAISSLGKAEDKVIDALIPKLKKGHSNAARALGDLHRPTDEVIDLLIETLKNGHSAAAEALGKLGRADDKVIDALIEALKNHKLAFRSAEALGKLGRADDKVIDALLNAFKRGHSDAAEALGALGKAEERVIKALVEALGNQKLAFRATKALHQLGRADETRRNQLIAGLFQHHEDHSWSGAKALIEPSLNKDKLLDALLDAIKMEGFAAGTAALSLANLVNATAEEIDIPTIWRLKITLSSRSRLSEIAMDPTFSAPLLKIHQATRNITNTNVLTWDKLDAHKRNNQ